MESHPAFLDGYIPRSRKVTRHRRSCRLWVTPISKLPLFERMLRLHQRNCSSFTPTWTLLVFNFRSMIPQISQQ